MCILWSWSGAPGRGFDLACASCGRGPELRGVVSLMVAEPWWRSLVAELILPLMVAELGGGTRASPLMVAGRGGEAWWRSSPPPLLGPLGAWASWGLFELFGISWATLGLFGPLGACWGFFGPLWASWAPSGLLGPLGPLRASWGLFGALVASWGLLGSLGASWSFLEPFGTSWGLLGLLRASLGFLELLRASWGLLGPLRASLAFCEPLRVPGGPLRTSWGVLGPLRVYWGVLGPPRAFSALFGPLRPSSGLFGPLRASSSCTPREMGAGFGDMQGGDAAARASKLRLSIPRVPVPRACVIVPQLPRRAALSIVTFTTRGSYFELPGMGFVVGPRFCCA